jgi:uncharacterized SAM-binding protein YcdF (DUF218 family)
MALWESIYRLAGWWIINVDMLFLVFLLGAGLLFALKKKKCGKRLLILSCSGFAFFGIIPVGLWTLEHLENRFPKVETIPADVKGIILLGGTFDLWTMSARKEPAYNLTVGKLIRFVELARRYPQLQLVFTGTKIEAETTKKELLVLGINPDRVIFEANALDTKTNASNTATLIQPRPEEKWMLLTSVYHLPRSVGLFRKAGFNVIPFPTDYHTPGKYEPLFCIGLKLNLDAWHAGSREWLGMVANYLAGRSSEVFPGPQ